MIIRCPLSSSVFGHFSSQSDITSTVQWGGGGTNWAQSIWTPPHPKPRYRSETKQTDGKLFKSALVSVGGNT